MAAERIPEMNFNDRKQVGLIAQEVEEEFPELVLTNKAGYKSVNYAAMVAPITMPFRNSVAMV